MLFFFFFLIYNPDICSILCIFNRFRTTLMAAAGPQLARPELPIACFRGIQILQGYSDHQRTTPLNMVLLCPSVGLGNTPLEGPEYTLYIHRYVYYNCTHSTFILSKRTNVYIKAFVLCVESALPHTALRIPDLLNTENPHMSLPTWGGTER